MKKARAWYTYQDRPRSYYFAPEHRTSAPYKRQVEVQAILDIAHDGTLAGVELVWGDLPPAPLPAPDER